MGKGRREGGREGERGTKPKLDVIREIQKARLLHWSVPLHPPKA
jgi:hypothetical protein